MPEEPHGSALIHDDVMDASDLRRGRPAAHRQFEALHVNAGWLGDSESFGKAGAIILGDLLVMWSAQMLHASGVQYAAAVTGVGEPHLRADDCQRGGASLTRVRRDLVCCGVDHRDLVRGRDRGRET